MTEFRGGYWKTHITSASLEKDLFLMKHDRI